VPLREPVRVAIVGAGYIAEAHLRALKSVDNVQIVAICDLNKIRAASLGAQWNIPNTYVHMEDMLDQPIDVVHVLVPPAYHAETTIKCLQRGWDVFLEKPMGVTLDECRNIARTADQQGRQVGVNHNFTYHPAFLQLTRAIRERRLGTIEHVIACMNVPLRQLAAGQHSHWMFQSAGNIVLEQACHPLSQLHHLLGPAKKAYGLASGEMKLNTGNRFFRTWQMTLDCERGTAQNFVSVGADFFDYSLHVVGQDGTALVDLRRNTICYAENSRFMDSVDDLRHAWINSSAWAAQGTRNFVNYVAAILKIKPLSDPFSVGFRNSISAFYSAYQAGKNVPTGLAQGIEVIDTCMRIVHSSGCLETELTKDDYARKR
jgi:predicted dehydrogenase